MILLPAGVAAPNHPRIGYRNIIEAGMLSSEQAADGFPVVNLANPATFLLWRGDDGSAQTITITVGVNRTIDYLGIARHNIGTTGATYALESSDNGTDWDPVVDDNPVDDRVIIHEFDPVTAAHYRLTIGAGNAAPQIAVLYLGEILALERRLYVGHRPVPFALRRVVSTGRSESGQFLGRTRRRESVEFELSMPNLTPAWVRDELEDFVDNSDVAPFFWAWRPTDYPDEVAYCWTTGDPALVNQRPNGMLELSASVQGIR